MDLLKQRLFAESLVLLLLEIHVNNSPCGLSLSHVSYIVTHVAHLTPVPCVPGRSWG